MSMHPTFNEVLAVGQGIAILLQPDQTAVAAQTPQRLDDGLQFVASEAGAPQDFRGCEANPGFIGEQRKNFLLCRVGHSIYSTPASAMSSAMNQSLFISAGRGISRRGICSSSELRIARATARKSLIAKSTMTAFLRSIVRMMPTSS